MPEVHGRELKVGLGSFTTFKHFEIIHDCFTMKQLEWTVALGNGSCIMCKDGERGTIHRGRDCGNEMLLKIPPKHPNELQR